MLKDGFRSIHRTYPRINHYESDGMGRDRYIGCNNGGFYSNLLIDTNPPNIYSKPFNKTFYSLKKNVDPFKYRSDGSGRDGYVLFEHGGLERDYKSLKEYQPQDFLRTPDSYRLRSKPSSLGEWSKCKTFYCSKEESNLNKKIRKIEKDLVSRLYWEEKPKFIQVNKYIK